MTNRRTNVASLRNLPQYKGLSDEEILRRVEDKLDIKIENRMKDLEEDYDLSDMKLNDIIAIERWVTITIRLEEAEKDLEERIKNGDLSTQEALKEEQRLSTMRRDMLELQRSLGIDRAKRRDVNEDDPRLLFEDIRQRAKKFLEERLCYVKCHKCGMVLVTVHFTYPNTDNKLTLVCERCEAVTEYTSGEILELEKENPYK